MGRCGGTSDAVVATEETQEILVSIKEELESKVGHAVEHLEAKLVSKQVVAGTNYFIKAFLGGEEYVHVRIFKSKLLLHNVSMFLHVIGIHMLVYFRFTRKN